MEIGDEILVKVKVVDFDSNPHGSAVKVEIKGFMDREDIAKLKPFDKLTRVWIHRLDQSEVIA